MSHRSGWSATIAGSLYRGLLSIKISSSIGCLDEVGWRAISMDKSALGAIDRHVHTKHLPLMRCRIAEVVSLGFFEAMMTAAASRMMDERRRLSGYQAQTSNQFVIISHLRPNRQPRHSRPSEIRLILATIYTEGDFGGSGERIPRECAIVVKILSKHSVVLS